MEELVTRFELDTVPYFIYLRDGKIVESFRGASLQRIEDTIVKHKN